MVVTWWTVAFLPSVNAQRNSCEWRSQLYMTDETRSAVPYSGGHLPWWEIDFLLYEFKLNVRSMWLRGQGEKLKNERSGVQLSLLVMCRHVNDRRCWKALDSPKRRWDCNRLPKHLPTSLSRQDDRHHEPPSTCKIIMFFVAVMVTAVMTTTLSVFTETNESGLLKKAFSSRLYFFARVSTWTSWATLIKPNKLKASLFVD